MKYKESSIKIFEFLYLLISDSVIFYLSFIVAYQIRFFYNFNLLSINKGIPDYNYYKAAMDISLIIYLTIFLFKDGFALKAYDFFDEFVKIFNLMFISTLIVLAISFFYRNFSFSRIVLGISFFVMLVLLTINHFIYRIIKIKILTKYITEKSILIIGVGKIAQRLKKTSRRYYKFKFYFIENLDFEKINNIIRSKKTYEVILTKFPNNLDELEKLILICEEKKIDIKIVPSVMELKLGEVIIDNALGLPILSIKSISMETGNYIKKRIFDISVTIIILTLSFPVLLIIAALIKITSKGKVIYKHKRRGYKGNDFNFYKFRTMIIDADKYLNYLKQISDRSGPVLKLKKDPRIIFVGSILRKLSLDEFPQFFNVLRGEMSIVGPRPQVLWEAEAYDKIAKRRLNVMPGITGLWQISGRADISYEEMIDLDIYYLENWTLALDIKIILMTLPAIFKAKGAY